jgi:hypothetical protein
LVYDSGENTYHIIMESTTFLDQHNIRLLWELLLEELQPDPTHVKLIETVFRSNLELSGTAPGTSLIDKNKRFLSQVVKAVNQLTQKQRITIGGVHDDQQQHITIEELHDARRSQFDEEVQRKREDFLHFAGTPKPPAQVNFAQSNSDDKIQFMDLLLAEKMAERNALQLPMPPPTPHGQQQQQQQPPPQQKQPKHVTFDEPVPEMGLDFLFQRLKRVESASAGTEDAKERETERENKYTEQVSMPLPSFTDTSPTFVPASSAPSAPSVPGDPVLPKGEIIKHLNLLTEKLDRLCALLEAHVLQAPLVSLDS